MSPTQIESSYVYLHASYPFISETSPLDIKLNEKERSHNLAIVFFVLSRRLSRL